VIGGWWPHYYDYYYYDYLYYYYHGLCDGILLSTMRAPARKEREGEE